MSIKYLFFLLAIASAAVLFQNCGPGFKANDLQDLSSLSRFPNKVVADDMVLDKEALDMKAAASASPLKDPQSYILYHAQTWKNHILPLEFADDVVASDQQKFIDACEDWAKSADLACKIREDESNYIQIENSSDDKCLAMVGAGQDGARIVSLSPSCWADIAKVKHLIGHVLGLLHEHQRLDRDQYVKVDYAHIPVGQEMSYTKMALSPESRSGNYDVDSIMNVGSASNIIAALDRSQSVQRSSTSAALSAQDRERAQKLYSTEALDVQGSKNVAISANAPYSPYDLDSPIARSVGASLRVAIDGVAFGAVQWEKYVKSVQWSQVSGPAPITIDSPTSYVSRLSNIKIPGDYVFQLNAINNKGVSVTSRVAQKVIKTAIAVPTPTPVQPPPTATPLPSACNFNGRVVAHGSSVWTYLASSSTSCQSQIRTCNNGVLSGSYAYASCTTIKPTPEPEPPKQPVATGGACSGAYVNIYVPGIVSNFSSTCTCTSTGKSCGTYNDCCASKNPITTGASYLVCDSIIPACAP